MDGFRAVFSTVNSFVVFQVQCRSRDHHDATTTVNEPRSVNRVVASLIRSIEDSRYAAPDRPAQLTVDNPGQVGKRYVIIRT